MEIRKAKNGAVGYDRRIVPQPERKNKVQMLGVWKTGYRSRANAQLVAEEILNIGESVTAAEIVDKARDEDTELHKCFEWNDSIAAERYRLVQAGEIIRHLVIRRTEEQKQNNSPEIRLFHHVKCENEDGESESAYKPIQYIVQNRDKYSELLQQAYADLHAFKQKYRSLKELDYILELID